MEPRLNRVTSSNTSLLLMIQMWNIYKFLYNPCALYL